MLRPNALELRILSALEELGQAEAMEVASRTGMSYARAGCLCRYLTMHDYVRRVEARYPLTPAGQKVTEGYPKEANPRLGNELGGSLPGSAPEGGHLTAGEHQGIGPPTDPGETMRAPLGNRCLLPSGKAGILPHHDGELQPPGSTAVLAFQRTKVLPAGSGAISPPGNMRVLPPGQVTIPLVSGVVAFK